MIVACTISVADLGTIVPDVLVLPERTTAKELRSAQRLGSSPLVVGAMEDGDYVRGFLLHRGRNQIDYLKILPDGTSSGSNMWPSKTPVYEIPGLAIGVLICRDYNDNPDLRAEVLDRLRRSSPEAVKLVCIPADMANWSFTQSGRILGCSGVYVALSNHKKTYDEVTRGKSVIADPQGERIKMQQACEAIHVTVP
jgi:predicted amidohydrolase